MTKTRSIRIQHSCIQCVPLKAPKVCAALPVPVRGQAYLQVSESDFTFFTPKVACGPLAEIFVPPPVLPLYPHRLTWWPTFAANSRVAPKSSYVLPDASVNTKVLAATGSQPSTGCCPWRY